MRLILRNDVWMIVWASFDSFDKLNLVTKVTLAAVPDEFHIVYSPDPALGHFTVMDRGAWV